jgi:hypothetical protein
MLESLAGGTAGLDAAETLRKKRQGQLRSGVLWMQAVAVLSAVNGVAIIAGVPFRLLFGLAFTDFAFELAKQLGPGGVALAVVALIAVAGGLFALAWIFKTTGQMWTAIMVIAVYTLDIVPTLLMRSYISAALHVIAIAAMVQGLMAFRALANERAASAMTQAVVAPAQPQVASVAAVDVPVQPQVAAVVVPEQPVVPTVPAGWYADPSGRHQYRYWDSRQWTKSVLNEGVASLES